MEFKQYPSYKNSGVEWLGEVPEHWQQKPIWSLFDRIKRVNYPNERLLSVYRDYGVILKDSRDDNHNRASEDLTPYQLVCPNDLVINKMKAWQGSIAISELRGIVSPAYYIYQPKQEYYSKYIHFLIRSVYYIQSYKNYSKGIRVNQWDLEHEAFTHIDLLLPSLDEQQKIVSFIETETARIDNLISKQEKLIELLEEQRKSIISHAVTKGLNPNAPMKHSGVDWLGEVPSHWKILKFNYVVNKIADVDHYMPNSVDEGYPYLMTGDLQDKISSIDFASCKKVSELDYIHLSKKIKSQKGDLILARYATIGTVSYVDMDFDFLVSYSCVTIKPNFNKIKGEYLYYYIKSQTFYNFCKNYINTNTQGNLGIDNLKRINILLPSLNEQKDIVNFLESENLRIEKLIDKQEKLIERLKEYRSSIISHAVTGKIDVRGFVA